MVLGPQVPAILLRAAHVAWLSGNPDLALIHSRQILAITAHFDSLLFRDYDRMGFTMEQVLERGLASGSRPAQAYFQYLLATNRTADLRNAWRWMNQHAFADEHLARDYTGFLFEAKCTPKPPLSGRATFTICPTVIPVPA